MPFPLLCLNLTDPLTYFYLRGDRYGQSDSRRLNTPAQRLLMVWNHLEFEHAPLHAGFLRKNLGFSECQNAPFLMVLGHDQVKTDQEASPILQI